MSSIQHSETIVGKWKLCLLPFSSFYFYLICAKKRRRTISSCSHFNLPGGLGGALQMMGKLGISIATVGNGRRIYIISFIIFIICIVNVVFVMNIIAYIGCLVWCFTLSSSAAINLRCCRKVGAICQQNSDASKDAQKCFMHLAFFVPENHIFPFKGSR